MRTSLTSSNNNMENVAVFFSFTPLFDPLEISTTVDHSLSRSSVKHQQRKSLTASACFAVECCHIVLSKINLGESERIGRMNETVNWIQTAVRVSFFPKWNSHNRRCRHVVSAISLPSCTHHPKKYYTLYVQYVQERRKKEEVKTHYTPYKSL